MSANPTAVFIATIISSFYWRWSYSETLRKQNIKNENSKEASLSLILPDDDQKERLQEFLSSNNKIYKFVLTGGPCSGKTTAMEKLQVFLRERGDGILCLCNDYLISITHAKLFFYLYLY